MPTKLSVPCATAYTEKDFLCRYRFFQCSHLSTIELILELGNSFLQQSKVDVKLELPRSVFIPFPKIIVFQR